MKPRVRRPAGSRRLPIISPAQLQELGKGELGYIRRMTFRQVRKLYPNAVGIPKSKNLYGLYDAAGVAIAIYDEETFALGHARKCKLKLRHLN